MCRHSFMFIICIFLLTIYRCCKSWHCIGDNACIDSTFTKNDIELLFKYCLQDYFGSLRIISRSPRPKWGVVVLAPPA